MKNAVSAIRSEPRCTAASDEKNLSIASKNERNESPTASGECTWVRLCGGHAQDYGERGRRPAPVFDDQVPPREQAQDESDEDRVVELAGDRDEVGHEVERHREI